MDTGFLRPTLAELIERVQSDFNTRIPGGDSRVRRSFLYVISRAWAGLTHGLYGYLDWIAKQVFPDTAEAENMERWASIWGLSRKAAVKATGTVTFTGVNGSSIGDGTLLRTSDEIEFVTTTAVIIASGTATANIEAVVPGDGGNLPVNSLLTFVSPISGVNAEALTSAVTGGEDTESDDSLRARLLTRLRQPPMGGAERDYIAWALEVPGVTRAWCYPMEAGPGTVVVRFMTDGLTVNGIPTSGKVTEVYDYIEIRRPVTAELFVYAPVPVALNFNITLKDENGAIVHPAALVAEVEAELRDMILRDAEPGSTILISHIREAISIAAGEYDHVMVAPTANVTHTSGQIAVPGTFTFT